MMPGLVLRLAGWRFRRQRADYYAYLAVLIADTAGQRGLRDLFEADAERYGPGHPRGQLSRAWAQGYQAWGGDLGQTWAGTLPADDVALLVVAQGRGAAALVDALAALAEAVRLLDALRRQFLGTVMAGLVALLVLLAMLLAVPFYTVPHLQQVFGSVPMEFHGRVASALFGLADGLARWLPLLLLLGPVLLTVLLASLPHWQGAWRSRCDNHGLWRLYRDMQGIRFLALLAILLRRGGHQGVQLRDAILAQLPGAGRWKVAHLDAMLAHLDDGLTDARVFATGLLAPEVQWYLADVVLALGLEAGVQQTRTRIAQTLVQQVAQRAVALRWGLLGVAVAGLLGLVLWHFAAIDDLRRGLQAYYASR